VQSASNSPLKEDGSLSPDPLPKLGHMDAQTRNSIGSLHRELVRDGPIGGTDSAGNNTIDGSGSVPEHIASTGASAPSGSQAQSTLVPPGGAGWIGRVQNRTTELCKWFGLPPTETLLDEFHCALRKRVLLQGRMYVFDHYVCFSSSVFGFVKKKVLPFQDVVAVRKKTHLRFPNSIEIEATPRHFSKTSLDFNQPGGSTGSMASSAMSPGTNPTMALGNEREFFTSFLSREDAYSLIMQCWNQCKPEAVAAFHETHRTRQAPRASANPLGSGIDGALSVINAAATKLTSAISAVTQPAPNRRVSTLEPEGGSFDGGRNTRGRRTDMSAAGALPSPLSAALASGTPETWGATGVGEKRTSMTDGGLQKMSAGNYSRDEEEEDDEDPEEGSSAAVWSVVENRPPPAQASDAKVILSAVLPGTPRDLFDALFADSSHLLEDFLEAQGNRRINLKPWTRHEQLGHVRDIQFVAPIKGAFGNWGVSHTQCYQSHRFCHYKDEHFVFESSQTMTDIPYGDCFTVDLRWDVRPLPPSHPAAAGMAEFGDGAGPAGISSYSANNLTTPFRHLSPSGGAGAEGGAQSLVDISVRVPFSRRCLFKKVIESGTHKQVTDTYTALTDELRRALEEQAANKGGPQVRRATPAVAGGGLATIPSMRHLEHAADTAQPTPRGRSSFLHRVPSTLSHGQGQGDGTATPGGAAMRSGGGVRGVVFGAGQRAVRAAGGLWEFVMSLLVDGMSPQLRTLTVVVVLVFLVQVVMFCSLLRAQHAAAPPAVGTYAPPAPAALPPSADLLEGLGATYWGQRLNILNAELSLLQGRMEWIAKEMAMAAQYAQAAGAGGGGGAGAAGQGEL